VERRGEIHGAVHFSEQWPNSSEPLREREGLPRLTDASSGCGMVKRCSSHYVVVGSELERLKSPTLLRAHGGSGRACCCYTRGGQKGCRGGVA
jgi:hypothetical protein